VKNPNDTNLANNEVCITLPVVPGKSCDLEIKKSISPNPLVSGQPATVTIAVTNVGAPCPPGSYPWTYVQDPEPAGLNFTAVIANPPGWSCAIGFGLPDEAHCRNNSTLPTAYTVSIFFHGTVHAPPGSTITNCATVSNQNDTNPANNKSCVIVPVKP
jgi:hypothetical protein